MIDLPGGLKSSLDSYVYAFSERGRIGLIPYPQTVMDLMFSSLCPLPWIVHEATFSGRGRR